MNITRTHLNYYINKKANIKGSTFKAIYKTLPTTDIHRLVNLNCDDSSLQRIERGRPEDKGDCVSALYDTISVFNKRSKCKKELVDNLVNFRCYVKGVRFTVINRILRRLSSQGVLPDKRHLYISKV